jgi:lauroyl/myristoyl acyltransferase
MRGKVQRLLLHTCPVLGAVLQLLAAWVVCAAFGDLGVLGAPLGWLAGSVLWIRRGHVEEAMGRAGLKGKAAGMYASLGTGVMELLWLAGGARRDLQEVAYLDPTSQARLDAALGLGRGAVFAASHTGNWELAACAFAGKVPLSVLVKRVRIGGFERFLWQLRGRYGVGLLDGPGALGEARRHIEAGRGVAVLIDQVPPRETNGDWLPFLGADALTDRAAALLAATTGAPLVVTASRRDEAGRHALHVLSVKVPPTRGRTAWAESAMREATAELDTFVRAYPEQWLWMHRRWKGVAGAGSRLGSERSGAGAGAGAGRDGGPPNLVSPVAPR